jgi:acyl-CoA thioesterase YciA
VSEEKPVSDPAPARYLALKAVMMPRDTNPHGTIFGGVLLSHLDQAGAVGAHLEIARAGWVDRPLVTIGMKSVTFHEPVFVGDVLSFWTELTAVGTTSITMHVAVEAERDGSTVQVTEADVTYVAVNLEGGRRRTVPIRGESGR